MAKQYMFPGVKAIMAPDGATVQYSRFVFPYGMDTGTKLHKLYEALGCDMVQVAYIEIGGREYTVFCDEEGKLKPWVPTLPLYHDGQIYDVIAGSFVVAKENEDGDFEQMTVGEFAAVEEYLRENVPKGAEEVRGIKNGKTD